MTRRPAEKENADREQGPVNWSLTRDPEMRSLSSGKAVTHVNDAVSRTHYR
jgi:hypothetical protein